MNWVKENKFLTGFIAVMVVGVGRARLQGLCRPAARSKKRTSATPPRRPRYNRLRRLAPFPNQKNLEAFEAQKSGGRSR